MGSSAKARLRIIQGPNKGTVIPVAGVRATIGRADGNDIVIIDLKASRRHAEIAFNGKEWLVRDLGSANGISVNGRLMRAATLRTGDQLGLGETVFEFQPMEGAVGLVSKSSEIPPLLGAALGDLKPLESIGLNGQNAKSLLVKYRPVVYGALALLGLLAYWEPAPKKELPQKSTTQTRNLSSFLPDPASDELSKSAENFFKMGFREYREGNYLRARTQFETVLQIHPSHRLARLYLDNCNRSIEEEVKFHLDHGRKSLESGKLKESKGHFESVLRLLFRDPGNPAFAEAKDQLLRVRKEMGG